jgi:hypothetical protein
MSLKNNLKRFFGAKEASDSAVELLRMFIIPFAREYGGRNRTVDDVIKDFFNVDTRRFYHGKATRNFKMPGDYLMKNITRVQGYGPRTIKKDQGMLMVVDKASNQVKIEVDIEDHYSTFILERHEFETIKDWLDVREA